MGVKGEVQENKIEDESTDTKNCGGTTCSSEEVSVMGMERRGCIKQVLDFKQLERGRINDWDRVHK